MGMILVRYGYKKIYNMGMIIIWYGYDIDNILLRCGLYIVIIWIKYWYDMVRYLVYYMAYHMIYTLYNTPIFSVFVLSDILQRQYFRQWQLASSISFQILPGGISTKILPIGIKIAKFGFWHGLTDCLILNRLIPLVSKFYVPNTHNLGF
jgi:hypothetical protein